LGVGGRQGELPERQAEAPRELLSDPERVVARQHERDPAGRLLIQRIGTPPISEPLARSVSSSERGCSRRKQSSSRSMSSARREVRTATGI
jgi:hypothetical protein